MQSKHFYEFGGFNFYPDTHALVRLRDKHPFSLTPKASILLALLIKRSGNLVKYGELRESVWPESPSVQVHTIHQTKNALRSALGDGAGIIETINGQGYRLNASVTERFNEEFSSNGADQKSVAALPGAYPSASPEAPPSLQCHDVKECAPLLPAVSAMRWVFTDHYAHVIVSCILYALLYSVALLVEVAYQFDWYGATVLKFTPLVFLWIFLTSVIGLRTTWLQTTRGKKTGILASLLILIGAALMLYIALGLLLPGVPITEANIQSYTAHGAYLKSVCYFLPLAVIFLILPFHFVVAARSELRAGPRSLVLALLSGKRRGTAPRGTIFLRPWWLGSLLFGCLAMSLVMTAHLFDNLKPHAYMNLFMQLVQWRGLLYFALGVECILWYAWSLSEIKHEHTGPVLKIGSSVEA